MFEDITDVKNYITKTVLKHSNKFVTQNYKILYSNRLSRTLAKTRTRYLLGKPVAIEFVFNTKYLNSFKDNEDEIKDTILHEIAHAIAGALHHHDSYWKSCAIKIGARPSRFANITDY